MCGIAGLMTTTGKPPKKRVLDALASSLTHRGPDGQGRKVTADVGMVHNRLAIIDLKTGDQPLKERAKGGAALVANGEIYNYVELRLELSDIKFATSSDCEAPLHLYRRDGLDFVQKLRGMYAIALHDEDKGRLVLARDPFGIKPLYYAETPEGLAFASEPQALIRAGLVSPKLDPRARDELLQLQFTTGRETIFQGIHRVLPGETVVAKAGRIVERRRLSALPEGGPVEQRAPEALAELDRVLAESVYLHQRSDVAYGMFLSGGIDSSALLAMMARLNDRPVKAFTAGFTDSDAEDERARARRVAAAVGAEHVEVDFGEDDFWSLLPQIAAAADDPAADYALLPTFKLAREAGRELKVVLCGEGGDELFAGYGRYRRALRPRWLGGRKIRSRGFLDGLEILREESPGWRDGIAAAERDAAWKGRSKLQRLQAVDCVDWLPHDLLTKLDRCLMAHGVEGRTPFLDPVVAGFAFRLSDSLKVRPRYGKWLLRRWLADNLPEAAAFTRKRGFTVPVAKWMARRGRELGALVAAQPAIEEICRPEAVKALFTTPEIRAGLPAWTLLFYALWHRRHILGHPSQGDVFETLSQPA